MGVYTERAKRDEVPIAILIVGGIMLVTAIRGNQNEVARRLAKDFTGAGNFFLWIGMILLLAIAGRVSRLPQMFKALISLIVVVYLISREGIFTKFTSAFEGLTPTPTRVEAVGSQAPITPLGLQLQQGATTP